MAASRSKGARGERELAELLRALGFANARRGVQYQGTPESPDICDAIKGVHIECKRTEALRLHRAFTQSQNECGTLLPVVMHKKSRQPWFVTLQLAEIEAFALRVLEERGYRIWGPGGTGGAA